MVCLLIKGLSKFQCQFLAQKERLNENWNGSWFPYVPGQKDSNQIYYNKPDLHDKKHLIKMGIQDSTCDDAKVCSLKPYLFFK